MKGRTAGIWPWLAIASAVCWGALGPAAAQDDNVLANSGFEDSLSGWEVVNPVGAAGKVEAATEQAFAGRFSLHVANADPNDLRPIGVRQTIAVSAGRTYRLAVRFRHTALKSSGGVRITILDRAGRRLSDSWPIQLHNWETGWSLAERAIRIPRNGARVGILLAVNGLGEAWFDEVSLTVVQPVRNPADEEVEQVPTGVAVRRYETPTPVVKIAAADVDGDGEDEVLCGGLDNVLRLFDAGEQVWEFDLGGFPCHIASGDMDGDGLLEIAASSMNANGDVFVLSPAGKRLWTRSVDDNRMTRVGFADLDGGGASELLIGSGPVLIAYDATFRRLWEVNVGGPRLVALTAADIDRDGRDEVLAGYEAQTLRVVAVDGTGGIAWRYNPSDWPGAATVSSLFAADLDGDGAPEIVGGAERQACFALRADGSPMWRGSGDRRRREIALAEPVRYAKQIPGTQVLLMGRRNFTVRAGSGPRIFSASSGLTLTDSASGTTQPNVIYLASSGFRDSAYYRLTFTHTGENALESYARPNPIGEGLDELYARVVAISPLPMPTGARAGRKFHVLLYRNNREQVRVVWPKLKARNTPNVEYEILTYAKELPVELHRFPMKSVPEILDYVRFFESEAIPFYLFVDHGCRPWISLETARQILDAAPNALRGFYCAEDNYDYPGDLFWDWLKWAGALLDLCHDRGKKVVFKEMYDCWSLLAADKRVYDVLFKYPDTVVPMFATNNAHAAEIQVGGMLGLWRAGACEDWGMSSQHWNWNWEDSSQRIDYADLCPPDVIFRMDLAAASLGCTYFHVEGGQKWLDNAGDLQPEAKRHRELLYQMIERNLLLPVSPSQLAGLSPVAIARTTDPGRAPGARIGLPRGRIGTPFRDGFLGVRGAIQTTPSEYFPAYAYGIQRFFDGLFPTTPYGYVQLVPAFLGDRQRVAEAFVETDTTDVIVAGRRMTARQARRTVLSMLKRAAAKLPFRCDGAFLSVQRWGDEYRLVVIDPGYLTPVGARAEIRTNLVRAPVIVSDLITNERVHVGDDSFAVAVPPGGLRLLSVKVR